MRWRRGLTSCPPSSTRTRAAGSPAPQFETLEAGAAREIEAIAAQIIPSTGGPGALEAGVIYFIDRALSTFASDERETYRTGMASSSRNARSYSRTRPRLRRSTGEQQMTLIRALEASNFFDLLRTHTVLGFLGNPSYGGNRGETGWKQIGFEDEMAYQPPFGYYDAQVHGEKK